MRCRRESAVGKCGNVSGKAGKTTHKRAPIVLRRWENRHLRGQLISPKEGTREKPAAFARKQRVNSPKRPTFARALRDFVPRLCAGQRNSESTERQRRACAPECERPARSPRCAMSHCAAPPSRNETLGCRRARDPQRSALPHSKAGKGAQALRATGGNSRCGSATRGAIKICVPTLGDFQGAWSRETRRCRTGAHALSRRRTRRLS